MIDQVAALKKAITTGALVSVGGALKPANALAFINLVVDQSAFLKTIYTKRMAKINADVNALDLADGQLVRVAEGTEPSAFSSPTNKGKTLYGLPVQLFSSLAFSALEDNQDDPNFQSSFEAMIATQVSNDLQYLGFQGTDDTGVSFLTLNKGWITKAEASATTRKVNTHGATAPALTHLNNMLAAMTAKYKSPGCAFIVSPNDYEKYVLLIADESSTTGTALLLSGKVPSYMGYPMVSAAYCPDGHWLFTDPKNLVMGMGRDVQRFREIKGTKRSIEYTFNLYCDYEILVDEALVIGSDQG